MKKIFKKFFSKDRINVISENLSSKDLYVLEIGIHKGDFSKQLAQHLQPKKLILVDPWIAYDDEIYSNSWYGNSSISNQVIQDQYFFEISHHSCQMFDQYHMQNLLYKVHHQASSRQDFPNYLGLNNTVPLELESSL